MTTVAPKPAATAAVASVEWSSTTTTSSPGRSWATSGVEQVGERVRLVAGRDDHGDGRPCRAEVAGGRARVDHSSSHPSVQPAAKSAQPSTPRCSHPLRDRSLRLADSASQDGPSGLLYVVDIITLGPLLRWARFAQPPVLLRRPARHRPGQGDLLALSGPRGVPDGGARAGRGLGRVGRRDPRRRSDRRREATSRPPAGAPAPRRSSSTKCPMSPDFGSRVSESPRGSTSAGCVSTVDDRSRDRDAEPNGPTFGLTPLTAAPASCLSGPCPSCGGGSDTSTTPHDGASTSDDRDRRMRSSEWQRCRPPRSRVRSMLDPDGRDLAGWPDSRSRGVRNHRHPWLYGQPFHPAPREIFDLSVETPPEAAGIPRRPFPVFGARSDSSDRTRHVRHLRAPPSSCRNRVPPPSAPSPPVRRRQRDAHAPVLLGRRHRHRPGQGDLRQVPAHGLLPERRARQREEPWGVWGGELLLRTAGSSRTSDRAAARPSTRARRSSSTRWVSSARGVTAAAGDRSPASVACGVRGQLGSLGPCAGSLGLVLLAPSPISLVGAVIWSRTVASDDAETPMPCSTRRGSTSSRGRRPTRRCPSIDCRRSSCWTADGRAGRARLRRPADGRQPLVLDVRAVRPRARRASPPSHAELGESVRFVGVNPLRLAPRRWSEFAADRDVDVRAAAGSRIGARRRAGRRRLSR